MIDPDKYLSELNIKIIGVGLTTGNVPMTTMLIDVAGRAAAYSDSAKQVTITVREPDRDGIIEYGMLVEYINGGSIFIGALRRGPHAPTEYHS